MAQFSVDILSDTELAESTGFADVQDKLDASNVSMIGLGTGGQAIYELLAQGYTAKTVVFDSAPANFAPYLDGDFASEQEALNRIFGNVDLTTASLDTSTLPSLTGWIWSNGDSQHPIETLELGAESISAIDGSWVEDQNAVGHVFSNQDYALAQRVTQYILTGDSTAIEVEDTGTE